MGKSTASSALYRCFRLYKNLVSLLLLASAGVALYLDDTHAATLLVLIPLVGFSLGATREQAIRPLLASIAKLVGPARTPLHKQLDRFVSWAIIGVLAVIIVINIMFAFKAVSLHDYALAMLCLVVAVLPGGLAIELSSLLSRAAIHLEMSEHDTPTQLVRLRHALDAALRTIITDNLAQLFVVLASIAGYVFWQVPLGLTVIQILVADLVIQALPVSALAHDVALDNQHKLAHLRYPTVSWRAVSQFVGFGLLSAALAYGNYILFFERRSLSPVHIDSHSHLYAQATTLTLLTLALCQLLNLVFVRSDDHHQVSVHLRASRQLRHVMLGSLVLLLGIIYLPAVASYFGVRALSFTDVLCALVAASIYALARLIQRRTRHYSRAALLHDSESLRHHPKLA